MKTSAEQPPSEQSHSHSHASASRRRLAWALAITGTVLVAEVVGAYISGSLALLADAGHMAADSLGLVIALIAATLMTRPRSSRRTWGWARSEVIAAAVQATLLLIICLSILWEAIQRLQSPVAVETGPMFWIGLLGLAANIASLLILSGGRGDSLNMKAAFLEVMTDALGSVAVIVAAIVAMTTGWIYADSVASLIIAVMILPRAFLLLRQSVRILLEAAPTNLDVDEVRTHLQNHPAVAEVHDLHVTTIGTGLVTLTAHVVLKPATPVAESAAVVQDIQKCLTEHFPGMINHATVQVDAAESDCHQILTH